MAKASATVRSDYLPPRPDWWKGRAEWRRDVVEIETYRTRYGITDFSSALGPEPRDGAQHKEWERIAPRAGQVPARAEEPER